MNPPYYEADRFRASPKAARAGAHMLDERGLDPWAKTASDIVKDGGTLTIIFRADGLNELLSVLSGRFGAIDVFPLHPRPDAAATRILVRAVRASKAPLQLLPGVILHEGTGNEFTQLAKTVLRDGQGLGHRFPPVRPFVSALRFHHQHSGIRRVQSGSDEPHGPYVSSRQSPVPRRSGTG